MEANEDVHSAALREIREETGLEVRELRLRGVINVPVSTDARSNIGIVVFVFAATAITRDVRPSEEGTLEWVARDRVTDLDLVERPARADQYLLRFPNLYQLAHFRASPR